MQRENPIDYPRSRRISALQVDVIVTAGPASTRAAKQATVAIPIVMAFDDDPVGSGFAASLARPGGNITGLSNLSSEITGKLLELLREIVPKLSRVGVLGDVTRPGIPQALREINLAADAFRVQVHTWKYESQRISSLHSELQARGVLMHSSCWGVPSSYLTEDRLQTSR